MNQGSRLQRVVGSFVSQVVARSLMELIVDQRSELIERGPVPFNPLHQQLCHV